MSYVECIARHSRDTARQLWQLGLENHRLLREQIDNYQIDCDYQVDGMTTLARRNLPGWEDLAAKQQREYDLLSEDGFDVCFLDEDEAQNDTGNAVYACGLCYNNDAQFHSGKFVVGLAQAIAELPHVTLYERSRVDHIKSVGVETAVRVNGCELRARRVFLSTNALVPQFIPELECPLRAERRQVLVTGVLPERPCRGSFGTALAWWREIMEADGRFRLLFGGGRTREEPDSLFAQFDQHGQTHPRLESEGFRPSAAHQQRLDTQFALLFPQLASVDVTHRWGGLQSFTADNLPQIGLFDADREIYGIAGFCGRGNCYSDVGAEQLAAKAFGRNPQLAADFSALIESTMAPDRTSANWPID
jgi:gamma-glutamylputrescine oxidase